MLLKWHPEAAAKAAQEHGLKSVEVTVKGLVRSRESVIRALAAAGLEAIRNPRCNPVPHNGVRPPKTSPCIISNNYTAFRLRGSIAND